MKNDLHPTNYPVIFVDTSAKVEFFTTSTRKNDEKRTVAGMDYFVIPIEISSASHPFYTGKQMLIDTARRVEKFTSRVGKKSAVAATRGGKTEKRAKKTAVRNAKKVSKDGQNKQ